MVKVVGVRFRVAGQIYYYLGEPNKTYVYNERVLVEADKNQQLGYVAIAERELAEEELPDGLKTIIRSATDTDLAQEAQNIEDAKRALSLAKIKVREHGLQMKLSKVDYSFDRAKLMFQFTSDGRVDFRDLVRDLAAEFRTRIELRQIGIRDEAKILGGVGPCGRPLCCSTFLGDFMPVSIKMAKDQNLSLNQTKISGLCGRLMCCLKYENDMYEEARRELPDYGNEVETPDGKGRVIGLNLLDRMVKVKLFGKEMPIDYDQEELKVLAKGRV